jgi:hypothetical protein
MIEEADLIYNSVSNQDSWYRFKNDANRLCINYFEPVQVVKNFKIFGASETLKFKKSKSQWELQCINWEILERDDLNRIALYIKEKELLDWSFIGEVDRNRFLVDAFFFPLIRRNKSIYFKKEIHFMKANNT